MGWLRCVSVLAALALGAVVAPVTSAGPAARANRALKRDASRLLAMPNGPPGIAITLQRGRRRSFLDGGRAIVGTRRPGGRPGGTRSVAVSVNVQSSPDAGDPAVFSRLRRVYGLAACAALAPG